MSWLSVAVSTSILSVCPVNGQLDPGQLPLVQAEHLEYRGAFRVPLEAGIPSEEHFSYGGRALCYHPANDSLFLTGHVYYQKVAEISIETPVLSSTLSELPRATLIQSLEDPTDGHRAEIGPDGSAVSGVHIGGLWLHGSELIGSVYMYYDAGGGAERSHFRTGTDLSASDDFEGMFRLGSMNPGFLAGYVTAVPVEWQSLFGGPLISGQCGLPIVGRGSWGPSIFTFDPSLFGIETPVPVQPLVYYTGEHATLGEWDNQSVENHYYNMSSEVHGAVFPAGTRSVLIFGRQGMGVPHYGQGTNDPSLHLQPVPGGGEVYVYDPADSSKGTHCWPYAYFVWAYDAAQLAQVRAGTLQPWELIPYAVWEMELPFAGPSSSHRFGGAAWDAENRTIYLSQYLAEGGLPVIHVYQLADELNPNASSVLAPVGNRSIPAGQPLQITVQGSDADGNTLQYSATGELVPDLSFSNDNVTLTQFCHDSDI